MRKNLFFVLILAGSSVIACNSSKPQNVQDSELRIAAQEGENWNSTARDVDFDFAQTWPRANNGKKIKSARWQGWIRPPVSGTYKFKSQSTSVDLTIRKTIVIGPGLVAGRFYPADMSANANESGIGKVTLEWSTPYGATYVIPHTMLFLPNDMAAK